MNKRERDAICGQIAQWEWSQGGSSSEASARSKCARDMVELFKLTDEDLAFHRAYEIYLLSKGSHDDEDYLDGLSDWAESDHSGLLDQIGQSDFDGLRERVLARSKSEAPGAQEETL